MPFIIGFLVKICTFQQTRIRGFVDLNLFKFYSNHLNGQNKYIMKLLSQLFCLNPLPRNATY